MEEALIARLLATTGVTALVSTRIYWVERPQAKALPSITLQVISPGRSYTFGGADGTADPRVQVDCWGRSYSEAKAVSRAVIDALEPPASQDGIEFHKGFLDAASDEPVEDLPGGGKVYRVSMDFFLWWRRV